MMIEVLKSKIHCARVTEANLNYMGRNMSNFTGDSDTDMRVGFNVGVGMEYQFTELSERALRETYLPPFKACVDSDTCTMNFRLQHFNHHKVSSF